MSLQVKLNDVIEGIESQSDSLHSYLNKQTGEIVLISEEELMAAEDDEDVEDYADWEAENIEIAKQILETDHYLSLPGRFDMDEYRLMEKFSLSITDESVREDIYSSIKKKGAFGRFRDKVHEYGLTDLWYEYRDSEIKELARMWCEENQIACVT